MLARSLEDSLTAMLARSLEVSLTAMLARSLEDSRTAMLARSLEDSLAHAGTRRIPDAIAAAGSCHTAIAVFIGRRFYANKARDSSDPLLNDRAARLVGKVVTVVEAVDDYNGRVRVGDSHWSARGGPAAAGERVRITGIDGNCLKVEAERVIPPA